MQYFIGIDPGKTGAIAVLDENRHIEFARKFDDLDDIVEKLYFLVEASQIPAYHGSSPTLLYAYLEKVHASPQMGVTSAFTFGQSYGYWHGVLGALNIPYELITPQKWQGEVLDSKPSKGPMPRVEYRKKLKAHITAFVLRAVPDAKNYIKLKKDQDIADAICLALYGIKTSWKGQRSVPTS